MNTVNYFKLFETGIHINTFFTEAILKLRSAAGDDIVGGTPGVICIERGSPIVLLVLSSVNWVSSESNVKSNFISTPSSFYKWKEKEKYFILNENNTYYF
jgi:hypothetical protein